MTEVFLATLRQVAVLLFFIFLGYFLRKKNFIGENGAKTFATVEMLIFLPANTFIALSLNLNLENIKEYLNLLLYGCAFLVGAIIVSLIFSHLLTKDKDKRGVFNYALAFSNSGYFGYPVIEGVLGMAMKAKFTFFCIPSNIAICSYGMYILTKDNSPEKGLADSLSEQKPKSFVKRISFLYSPVMIATYLGIIVGLLPFEMPEIINTAITTASNCMSPVAMLLTGIVLASLPIKKLFCSFMPYLVGIIRLIIIPLIFGSIAYLIGLRGETLILSTILFALPVGMNVVVFPESVGKDSSFGASMCFISYIMALITIPIAFAVIQSIA